VTEQIDHETPDIVVIEVQPTSFNLDSLQSIDCSMATTRDTRREKTSRSTIAHHITKSPWRLRRKRVCWQNRHTSLSPSSVLGSTLTGSSCSSLTRGTARYSHCRWTEPIEVEGATSISRNQQYFEDSYAPTV
jgi:hypothetical protein